MTDQITYWYGKRVDAMSREELLEVINEMAKQINEFRSPLSIRAYSLGRVEMLRRGETR